MNDFFRDDQVRGAQNMLARLREVAPEAVVLGGWAVWLYTQGQRSTDVDVAVDFDTLGRLQAAFPGRITKNNNLRKYELIVDRVEVDILVVRFSNAGIPIEELLEPTQTVAGFRVMSPEGLLAMKLCAWMDRVGRPKGDKDESDVLSLLHAVSFDWSRYRSIIAHAEPRYASQFPGAVARLITSADLRRTWQHMKVNGEPVVTTTIAWSAFRRRVAAHIPRGT